MTDGFFYDHTVTPPTISKLEDLLPRDSGWSAMLAFGINDTGYIVGQGAHNGAYHAFRMKPSGTGPNTPDSSKSPALGGPTSSQGLSAPAGLLSGTQTNGPLGGTTLNAPAAQPPEQQAAASTTAPRAAAPTALLLLPTPSASDLLFAALGLEWTSDMAGAL
jgi:hypothetical protein